MYILHTPIVYTYKCIVLIIIIINIFFAVLKIILWYIYVWKNTENEPILLCNIYKKAITISVKDVELKFYSF